MNNIYSAYHYACKTKADRKAIEELAPKVLEAADKAAFGNIGDIQYTARTTAPIGGEWCDGATYTKDIYPVLYDMLVSGKLQYVDIDTYNSVVELNGSCGFFGLDVASQSFKVPTLTDVYIKAGQAAETFGAESLPNITGTFEFDVWSDASTGAFSDVGGDKRGGTSGDNASKGGAKSFNASNSSSTYQDGAKVNPDHVTYRAYVILYTGKDISFNKKEEYKLNNPFFFGMSQFFEVDPKNASWLKSDGAFHSGAVYESFYEWLVKEYNNPDRLSNKINANVVGNPTINNSIVSGFTTNNYLETPTEFSLGSNVWEWSLKFVMGTDVSATDWIFGSRVNAILLGSISGKLGIWLSSNGTSWNIDDDKRGSTVLVSGETYYIKIGFTGSEYYIDISTDGSTYKRELSISSSLSIYPTKVCIGSGWDLAAPFTGSFDLSSCFLKVDNQIWWKGIDNAVRKPTEQYSDYDYVIDTANTTFRLPIKVKLASGSAVVGNGIALGLTTGSTNFGYAEYNGGTYGNTLIYGQNTGSVVSHSGGIAYDVATGITTTPSKSGIETSSKDLKLYFYVGDTIQDPSVIDASKILEILAKMDYVVESKVATETDRTWYRKYKSGWVEQGGYTQSGKSVEGVKIPLVLEMNNAMYSVSVAVHNGESYNNSTTVRVHTTTNNSFNATGVYSGGYGNYWFYWTVSGQGA